MFFLIAGMFINYFVSFLQNKVLIFSESYDNNFHAVRKQLIFNLLLNLYNESI